MRRVILYTKAGCSLCVKVRHILDKLCLQTSLLLEEVDITTDPAIYELYKDWIPVVLVDDREAMRGIPNEMALRKALGLDI